MRHVNRSERSNERRNPERTNALPQSPRPRQQIRLTDRKLDKEQLRTLARQQAALADLGQQALTTTDLAALMDGAVSLVAETLAVEYCKVLELLPDGSALRLQAGVGWRNGLVGAATVSADTESQAGYTLLSDEPVVVEDLRTETRFSVPPLLRDHGVVSGLSVVIRGQERPFGVLGAHTATRRAFTVDDVSFAQSVANVLGQAVQRQRAEAALRDSEQRFRALIEKSLDLISILDRDGTYRYLNPAHEAVYGFRPDELVGTKAFDLLHPDDAQKLVPILADAIRTGVKTTAGTTVEYRLRHQDGSWRAFEGRALNLLDDPEIAGILITGRDITERKRAAEEIRRLNAELEQRVLERTAQLEAANNELGAFSYSVSHDLQAPLRHINGFSKLLLGGYADKLDERGKHYLDRVCSATEHMGQLISDLLSLSWVVRGDMQSQPVNLSALAQTVAEESQKTQPERQVEFVITAGLVVRGDARLLRVALGNLLGNAWKYTSKHPRARIEFGVTQVNGQPAYFVRDDGAGFDMAYAGKLFGAFQRLHRSDEFEGSGIGLATVQRIIHRHGGRIWAEGAVEQGATFYFTLAPSSSNE
jgi:PAS domain S-box-containing protein